MEIKSVDECFRFRLLIKIEPSKEKSDKSIEIARKRLENAKKGFNLNLFSYVILEAYMAMFHASRALLYIDGIQEKSHFAIYIYLKEKWSSKIPLHILNFLNIHRTERHEAMYGFEYEPKKEDAEIAVKDAKIFIEEIEKVL